MFQIGSKKVLCLKKLLEILLDVIRDFKGEEIVGTFYEKELQKQIKSLELEK